MIKIKLLILTLFFYNQINSENIDIIERSTENSEEIFPGGLMLYKEKNDNFKKKYKQRKQFLRNIHKSSRKKKPLTSRSKKQNFYYNQWLLYYNRGKVFFFDPITQLISKYIGGFIGSIGLIIIIYKIFTRKYHFIQYLKADDDKFINNNKLNEVMNNIGSFTLLDKTLEENLKKYINNRTKTLEIKKQKMSTDTDAYKGLFLTEHTMKINDLLALISKSTDNNKIICQNIKEFMMYYNIDSRFTNIIFLYTLKHLILYEKPWEFPITKYSSLQQIIKKKSCSFKNLFNEFYYQDFKLDMLNDDINKKIIDINEQYSNENFTEDKETSKAIYDHILNAIIINIETIYEQQWNLFKDSNFIDSIKSLDPIIKYTNKNFKDKNKNKQLLLVKNHLKAVSIDLSEYIIQKKNYN